MSTIDHVWASHRFLKVKVIIYLQGEGMDGKGKEVSEREKREGEDMRGRKKGEERIKKRQLLTVKFDINVGDTKVVRMTVCR